MLSWPAKPREEDGIWAKYWYHSLHKSTGFLPYRPKANFPVELKNFLRNARLIMRNYLPNQFESAVKNYEVTGPT